MASSSHRVAVVLGTRPEAIKLCPVILAMRAAPGLQPHLCVTAQHREMLDQTLAVFGVAPDVDLDLMAPGQSLAELSARVIAEVDGYLAAHRPDLVLVQGDTTTSFCAALAAFYRRIPVGHVEAGLRTWQKCAPYPEEMNRVLTARLADHHFAPTARARDNLLSEGLPPESVHVTGNTVIDALRFALGKVRAGRPEIPGLPREVLADAARPLVLVTGHRRENFGAGFRSICEAIATLARRFQGVVFAYPVHLNPNVRAPVFGTLGGLPNVFLLEPLEYLAFVSLLDRASLVLTDSGGVQEEAPSLGKPVLVMRDATERPEVVEAGAARLVGADRERIVEAVSTLLGDERARGAMARAVNPYGDGHAAERIVEICARLLADGRA